MSDWFVFLFLPFASLCGAENAEPSYSATPLGLYWPYSHYNYGTLLPVAPSAAVPSQRSGSPPTQDRGWFYSVAYELPLREATPKKDILARSRTADANSSPSQCGKLPPSINSLTKEVELSSPWRVEILLEGGENCAGTLVGDRWILTAARCFPAPAKQKTMHLLVGLGGKELSPDSIRNVLVYPGFNEATLEGDVALIELETPLHFSSKISPACLPTEAVSASQIVGSKDFELPNSPAYRSDLAIARKESCSNLEAKEGSESNSASLCLMRKKSAQTCKQILVGHPLLYKDSSQSGSFTVVGILSLTSGRCPEEGVINIFMKVALYIDWINEQMNAV